MTKKIICAALVLTLSAMLLASCGANSETSTSDVSDSTNLTVVEEVTDENGETVTDEAGEAVTEVYEQIPVLDENGDVVKDEKGEVVTKKVPATEAEKEKNAGTNSGSTTKKQSGSSTTTKPSSGSTTTKPSGGSSSTTTKPSSGSTTTKPSGGSSSTTTKPTEKPTESTTERSENIDYFVSYAIQYGTKTLGLTYRSDITNANGGSNDTPIPITSPVVGSYKISYKEAEVRDSLQMIKSEGFTNFWVSKQKVSGNSYELYIGYYIGI
mgnify:CR=1 FL=1